MPKRISINPERANDILSQNWLFGALYPEEIDQIANFGEYLEFAALETVIEKGSKNDSIWIILQGECRLALAKTGPEQSWVTLREGDMFGEMAWLDGFPASATIQTGVPALLMKLSYNTLNRFLDANLSVSNIILRKLAINLAGRLRAQSPAK